MASARHAPSFLHARLDTTLPLPQTFAIIQIVERLRYYYLPFDMIFFIITYYLMNIFISHFH